MFVFKGQNTAFLSYSSSSSCLVLIINIIAKLMSFFASLPFVNFSAIFIGGFSKILVVELVYCTMCQALLKMRIWNRLKFQNLVKHKCDLVISKKNATKTKIYLFVILQQALYHLLHLLCYCFCKLHFFKLYFSDEGGWSEKHRLRYI